MYLRLVLVKYALQFNRHFHWLCAKPRHPLHPGQAFGHISNRPASSFLLASGTSVVQRTGDVAGGKVNQNLLNGIECIRRVGHSTSSLTSSHEPAFEGLAGAGQGQDNNRFRLAKPDRTELKKTEHTNSSGLLFERAVISSLTL